MAARSIIKFLSLAFTIGLAVCNPPNNTIINGDNVRSMTEFSYQVFLTAGPGQCGGTIISEWHILTAAHCVESNYGLAVYTGSTYQRHGEKHAVRRYWIHPNYIKGQQVRNDIAVLELARQIRFNRHQNRIPLPTSAPHTNTMVTISGWGRDEYGQLPANLKSVQVTLITWQQCVAIYGQYGMYVNQQVDAFCTNNGGRGIWSGDSGGPVVQNGKVVGVVSRFYAGYTNNPNQRQASPDVHTNVFYFLNWIKQCMNADSYPGLAQSAIYPRGATYSPGGGYYIPGGTNQPKRYVYYPGIGWVIQ